MGQNLAMVPEARRALRMAVSRGDGAGVLAALGGSVPEELLQLVGDALLVALAQDEPEARALAERCTKQLQARGWCGDPELATELEAALVRKPTALPPVAVDLEELSELLEAGLGDDGGRLDLQTGEAWSASTIEYAEDSGEELPDFTAEGRWLFVYPEGSDEGYRDMQDFIATVPDPDRSDRLAIAIDAGAPSADSRMSSLAGPTRRSAGTASARSVAAVGPATGWHKRAIGRLSRVPLDARSNRTFRPTDRSCPQRMSRQYRTPTPTRLPWHSGRRG